MAKTKITEIEEVSDRTLALTPAEYWEWRTTISDMECTRYKFLHTQAELKVLTKEAEILAVRSQLFSKTRLESSKAEYENAKAEYDRYKKVLEDRLGVSLNGKLIDDVTFEVRDLPEQQTPPEGGKGH